MLQDKTFQSLDKICSFGCQCYKNAEIFMVLISKFEKPIYSRVHSSSIRALIFFTPGFRATVYNFVIKGHNCQNSSQSISHYCFALLGAAALTLI